MSFLELLRSAFTGVGVAFVTIKVTQFALNRCKIALVKAFDNTARSKMIYDWCHRLGADNSSNRLNIEDLGRKFKTLDEATNNLAVVVSNLKQDVDYLAHKKKDRDVKF